MQPAVTGATAEDTMSRITVVGEALVDVVTDAFGSREHPGGSPLNVAVGLARLGHETTLVTRLGADCRGQLITDHLTAAGVRLGDGAVDDAATSVATATLDQCGRADYQFELLWRVPSTDWSQPVDHLHTGSIAAFLPPGAADVTRLVHQHRSTATVSFDPNIRPAIIGAAGPARERVEELVSASDIVKASDEDLAWLFPGDDPGDVAARWLALGPALVVVTRGEIGASAIVRAADVSVAAPEIDIVDTVGAGDAFMAALLDGLAKARLLGASRRDRLLALSEVSLTDLIRHAVHAAAYTCTRAGANPPTQVELHRWANASAPP